MSDGRAVYWLNWAGTVLRRQTGQDSPTDALTDAGRVLVAEGVEGHILLLLAERLGVLPTDGGSLRKVGPLGGDGGFVLVAFDRTAALYSPSKDLVTLWDVVSGVQLRTVVRGSLSPLGFGFDGALLAAECQYRADDAGLDPVVHRLRTDDGGFEPWSRASCPRSLLRDGAALYLSDISPDEGKLSALQVLRRLDEDGTSTLLPWTSVYFVRRGFAFRPTGVHQGALPLADGGFIREADGGLMLVRVPGAIEAVPLDGGAAVRVAELDAGLSLRGFAVDDEWSYQLREGEDALRAERLPPVLRLP